MTEQRIMEQAAVTAEYFLMQGFSYVSKNHRDLSESQKIEAVKIFVNACITDQNTMINNPKR